MRQDSYLIRYSLLQPGVSLIRLVGCGWALPLAPSSSLPKHFGPWLFMVLIFAASQIWMLHFFFFFFLNECISVASLPTHRLLCVLSSCSYMFSPVTPSLPGSDAAPTSGLAPCHLLCPWKKSLGTQTSKEQICLNLV